MAGQEIVPINVPEKGVPLWVEHPQTCQQFTPLGSLSNALPSSTPTSGGSRPT